MRKNSKTTVKAAKETAAKTTAAAKETVEKTAAAAKAAVEQAAIVAIDATAAKNFFISLSSIYSVQMHFFSLQLSSRASREKSFRLF